MTFNPKDFSIQQEIQKRANLESLVEWSKSPPIPTPKVIESKPISWSARLRRLLKSFII